MLNEQSIQHEEAIDELVLNDDESLLDEQALLKHSSNDQSLSNGEPLFSEVMLTTVDNPFDPFEQFTSWNSFDVEKGYNTCSYLARIAKLSEDMTQKEENEEIERAIDEIIRYDFMDIYLKVKRKSKNN